MNTYEGIMTLYILKNPADYEGWLYNDSLREELKKDGHSPGGIVYNPNNVRITDDVILVLSDGKTAEINPIEEIYPIVIKRDLNHATALDVLSR